DAVPDYTLPAQRAGREIERPDVTGRVVLNPTIGADDQHPVRDRRITVEAGWATIILDVECPPRMSVSMINREHVPGARADVDQIPRDRGGRLDSAVSVELPADRRIQCRGVIRGGMRHRIACVGPEDRGAASGSPCADEERDKKARCYRGWCRN